MNMKRTTCFLLFILMSFAGFAQMMQPVSVDVDMRRIDGDKADLVFRMKIDEGWHVYGTERLENGPTPTSITFEEMHNAELTGGLSGEGDAVRKYDEVFELEVEYFEGEVQFVQHILTKDEDFRVEGYLEYSACNNQSCLPPMKAEFSFSNGKDSALTGGDGLSAESLTSPNPQDMTVHGDMDMGQGVPALPLVFLWGLLGGLIALTTPCVWPIIPMTVSFFIKKEGSTRRDGVKDALLYGLSIIVIYVSLGLVVTGLFGANALNSLATNAVFNVLFFLMLLVFGLSLVGLFEITLPARWTTLVDNKAEGAKGILAIFLMAFTLVLVSFSCTGPIIGFLLVELATDGGSLFAPAVGMLGFSVGLALPFTLFALFPGWLKQMPKSGSWMQTVKVVLGVVELAFSLKFLSVADLAYGWGLLSRNLFFCIWILLFAGLGIYLIVRMLRGKKGSAVFYTLHLLGAVCSIGIAAYMVPGLWGAPCTAVSAFAPPMQKSAEEREKIFTDYFEGMQYAREQGMPVIVDFSGYGCVNCRKMEAAVFTDSLVADIIYNKYVFVQLFVDDRTKLEPYESVEENGKVRKLRTLGDKWSHLQATKFGVNSQPFYVLLDNSGNLLAPPYAYDEDVDKFVRWLKSGLK